MHLPPQLALLLTLGFMAFLFYRDSRSNPNVTKALWLPVIWLFIIGSRFVSQWIDIFGFHFGAANLEDGSPLDAVFFGLLILLGLYVLYQRRVSLTEVLRNNRWMTIFLVYCFLAILWSDFPFVAFKRWLKVLGHPIMVLVILTEPDREEAIIQLLKRCSFVWAPISILWIKYFPELGRAFSPWDGSAENNGITENKNMLGLVIFIVAAFFFWYFLRIWRQQRTIERRNELILIALFGCMMAWLFNMAHSATSLVSFLIASALILFLNSRHVDPRHIGRFLLGAVIIAVVAEGVFGIYGSALHLLGKNPTLTDRTFLWHNVLQMKVNPILGAGYESFWLGDHINPANWRRIGFSFVPNEAHNCYLETYLNLGLLGLALLIGWFIATYQKARYDLIEGVNWGSFRIGYLIAVLFYNWTEAPFKAVDPVYFVYFLIGMDYPKAELATATKSVVAENTEAGMDTELVSAKA